MMSYSRAKIAAFVSAWLVVLTWGAYVKAQTQAGSTTLSPSQIMCPDAKLWGSSLVTNICWSCLFPMRLMGTVQLGSGKIPSGASDKTVCFCSGSQGVPEIGFVLGMWAPMGLVELVRQPYCSPALGGVKIRSSWRLWGMPDGSDDGSSSNQFYSYHYFAFPLYEILQLYLNPECNAGGYVDFDLLYLSEIDPTWEEDELAVFTQPEVAVAANPLLQVACPADCAAATLASPLDGLWWCAGCWGSLYPFTGNVPSGGSPPRVSSLLATRALAAMHRRGLAWRSMGNDVLCGGKIAPMIPKQQYKMSMVFPVAEAAAGLRIPQGATQAGTGDASLDNYNWTQKCCHNIGVPTMLWGEWRNIPAVGEDFIYLLWRWTDCCVR
jgi:conjugal transfer pilus assembly protein TraU